jgi:hypothetical protein
LDVDKKRTIAVLGIGRHHQRDARGVVHHSARVFARLVDVRDWLVRRQLAEHAPFPEHIFAQIERAEGLLGGEFDAQHSRGCVRSSRNDRGDR